MTAVPAGGPVPARVSRDPRVARRREALLLAFAILTVWFMSLNLHLARATGGVDWVVLPAVLGALAVAAHLAVRRWAPAADPVLLPVAVAINGIGLVLIRRLDAAARTPGHAAAAHGTLTEATLQLVWTALAIAIFVGFLAVVADHRNLARYSYTAAVAGLFLLFLPAVLPARFSEVNGARLWIRVAGFSIQPSEIAKLALTVFFADYLARKRALLTGAGRHLGPMLLPRGRDLGPVLLAWAASVLILVGEKDLGNGLLFFGIFIGVLYVATARPSWLVIGLVLFLVGAYAATLTFPHVAERVHIWLHPFRYYETSGYQLSQGLFGLAQGGITGTGLGQGQPYLVPFASTDFITSTAGEELGLAGLMALITLYLVLGVRGLSAALRVRDEFGKLLAAGLAISLCLQVFIVIGGVTRLIPLTGKTLPFLSYGGSSLLGNYLLIAMLLRLSHAAGAPPAPAHPLPSVAATSPTTFIRRS